MKLTKREKVMLIILGLILFLLAFYNFLIKPQLRTIKELEERKLTFDKRYQNTQSEITPEKDIKFQYKKLNTVIYSMTDKFLPFMYQEKIIVALDNMLKDSMLEGYSITFTEPEIGRINEEKMSENQEDIDYILKELTAKYLGKNNKEEKNEENKEKEPEISVEKMTANIFFKGNYASLIDFLRKVEEYEKKIIIQNLNVVRDEKLELTGSIVLELYSIPKIHTQDEGYIKWDFNNDYGKDNPFYSSNSLLSGNSENKTKREYDFVMTVKPESSDLPTIVLGRTNDVDRSTYVYADSNSIEDIDIYFIQDNDKYYYKYKTSRESYPNDFKNGVEFIPRNENINMQIFTHERNSSTDLAGARIKIFNDTDKKVVIDIINDDYDKPRVNVIGESNIVTNRVH